MKKLLLAALMLISSVSFAQSVSATGEIILGNGQTTVGIRIGNPNPSNTQLVERVLMLERAVQDLQVKVFNLTVNDLPDQSLFECSLEAFGKMYFGQGNTQNIAISNVKKACLAKNNSMFCDKPSCSQLK